jgi:hypothetical protein
VDVEQVHRLAEGHLSAALPRRWRHVQGVASRAAVVAPLIGDQGSDLVCAAWLHDIGYAPPLAALGFHPLDGARYLTAMKMPRRLVCLVARHSCAALEAELRGLAAELAAFHDESGAVRDALWYCDITTSPDGERVTAEQRITEIKERYGPDHLVTRFITQAAPELLAAVERTEHRMTQSDSG